MKMLKKIAILFIIIPAMLLTPGSLAMTSAAFQAPIAVSMLLAEVDSEEVLFEYNMNLRHPADSLTKVMTLLLAVEAIEDGKAYEDEMVEMTTSAWTDITSADTTLNIKPGEEMPLLDLMYGAYFGKSGEACNMIAERIAGDVEAFVRLMNDRAKELGCETTRFANTHGRYDANQYTTAHDQFLIFREAVSKPLFAEMTKVFRHTLERTNMSEPRRLTNSNSLVNQNGKYYFKHCTSGIASVTFEGGHSFVGSAETDGLSLIAVVLGSDEVINDDDSVDMHNLTEARRLFEWGYAEFGWRTILSSTELVDKAPILHGAGADFVNLRPESSIVLLIKNDIPLEEFVREVTIYSVKRNRPLVAPVEVGDVLGEITVSRLGKEYGPILLVANTSIELHRFEYIRRQVSDLISTPIARYIMWTLIVLVAGYAALVIRYNVIRRKRLNRIAQAKRKLAEERMNTASEDEFLMFREFTSEDGDGNVREDPRPRSGTRELPRGASRSTTRNPPPNQPRPGEKRR